jgi:hypothetical protein
MVSSSLFVGVIRNKSHLEKALLRGLGKLAYLKGIVIDLPISARYNLSIKKLFWIREIGVKPALLTRFRSQPF